MSLLKSKRFKLGFAITLFLIVVVVLVFPRITLASVAQTLTTLICTPITWIIAVLGKLLGLLVGLMIKVTLYNNFIHATAVTIGWGIIRDICNMFFILFVLIMAFGTLISGFSASASAYSYKRILPKMIIAVLLVNFSKFLCGIVIDFGQIVMLTFASAIQEAGAGNMAKLLGITKLLNASAGPGGTSSVEMLASSILGLIMVGIGIIVIAVIVILLIYRIVYLWFQIMLAPAVFTADILPITKGLVGKNWWDKFFKQVIIGPVMVFFVWLAFAVVEKTNGVLYDEGYINTTGIPAGAETQAGDPKSVLAFIFGIMILLMGLQTAQTMGVAGGALAGKVAGKIKAAPGKVGKIISGKIRRSTPVRKTMANLATTRENLAGKKGLGWLLKTGKEKEALHQQKYGADKAKAYRRVGMVSKAQGLEKNIIPKLELSLSGKSNEGLKSIARGKDQYKAMAATQLLAKKGEFKGDIVDKINNSSKDWSLESEEREEFLANTQLMQNRREKETEELTKSPALRKAEKLANKKSSKELGDILKQKEKEYNNTEQQAILQEYVDQGGEITTEMADNFEDKEILKKILQKQAKKGKNIDTDPDVDAEIKGVAYHGNVQAMIDDTANGKISADTLVTMSKQTEIEKDMKQYSTDKGSNELTGVFEALLKQSPQQAASFIQQLQVQNPGKNITDLLPKVNQSLVEKNIKTYNENTEEYNEAHSENKREKNSVKKFIEDSGIVFEGTEAKSLEGVDKSKIRAIPDQQTFRQIYTGGAINYNDNKELVLNSLNKFEGDAFNQIVEDNYKDFKNILKDFTNKKDNNVYQSIIEKLNSFVSSQQSLGKKGSPKTEAWWVAKWLNVFNPKNKK